MRYRCKRAENQSRRSQIGHSSSVTGTIVEFQDLMKYRRRIDDSRVTSPGVRALCSPPRRASPAVLFNG
jgi:hypothetical protein